MTAVKIRHEDDAKAQFLANVPFSELDNVIPTICGWGIQDTPPDLSGQFVYTDEGAYFEVVIHGGTAR